MSESASRATRTLSAMFDSQSDAQHAIDRLLEAGVPAGNVRLVPGHEGDEPVTERKEQHRGFFGALTDLFMPDEDRYSYAEGLSRGGVLVVVDNLSDVYYDDAVDILDDEGSIDLDEREESWRSEGWTGYEAGGRATYDTSDADTFGEQAPLRDSARDFDETDSDVIPVVDENLVVGKRDVNLGRVRVRSYVREEPVSADVNLHEEHVSIDRRTVDRPLTDADAAFGDRTIEAEEHAEEAVVGKEARVTEEISLRRESTDHKETIHDTVRKTEVEVEDDRDANGNLRQNDRR